MSVIIAKFIRQFSFLHTASPIIRQKNFFRHFFTLNLNCQVVIGLNRLNFVRVVEGASYYTYVKNYTICSTNKLFVIFFKLLRWLVLPGTRGGLWVKVSNIKTEAVIYTAQISKGRCKKINPF